jgi:hypothetical protein
MKVVRVIVYDGDEQWLNSMMAKSLHDGEQDFLTNGGRSIVITTVLDERKYEAITECPPGINRMNVDTPPFIKNEQVQ